MQVNLKSKMVQKNNQSFGVSIKTNYKIDEWFVKRGIHNEVLDTFKKIIKEHPEDERTFTFHGTYNPRKSREERWIYVSDEKNLKDSTGRASLLIDDSTDIKKTLKKLILDYKIAKALPPYIKSMGKKSGLNMTFDSSNCLYNPNGTLPPIKGYIKRFKEFSELFSFLPEKEKYDISFSVLEQGMTQRVVVDVKKDGKRVTSCLDDVVDMGSNAYPNLTKAIPALNDAKIEAEKRVIIEHNNKISDFKDRMQSYQESLKEITGGNNAKNMFFGPFGV